MAPPDPRTAVSQPAPAGFDPAPPTRWPRAARLLIAGLAATLLIVIVVSWMEHTMSDSRVISKVTQSAGVTYPDERIHYAGVVEERTWVFGRHRLYRLVLGSDPSINYGHWVTFEAPAEGPPKIVNADWRRDGVRLRMNSGHEVFAPARKFLGGR